MSVNEQNIRDIFHRCGLRCTRQRELVYGALAATKLHPTAEELYRTVQLSDPGVSLATVYNTLDALLDCGLARRIPGGEGPARFDAHTHAHVHLVLPGGRVTDVPDDLSDRLLAGLCPQAMAELESRLGIRVDQLSLQLVAHGSPVAVNPA
mgnify:CR=1 FL=1